MSGRSHAFSVEMVRAGGQLLRAGHRPGRGPPLLLFNGIGANIELLDPFARLLEREIVTFDVPGVGHSPLGAPYRLRGLARLAAQVLDHFGHRRADVLGISWGGAAAQEFARSQRERCRRLVLCATATGTFMIPGSPSVLIKLATPLRYLSTEYAVRVAGHIYGGDFRRDPGLAREVFRSARWQSWLGYYLQLAAAAGWTSIHWLHRIEQQTLVMAGIDDPIVPPVNARLMCRLIPNSEIKLLDCGHLFLLTRAEESARAVDEFLSRDPQEVET